MPITVYLDTQDFSKLADAASGRGPTALADLLQRLLALKAQGVARFIYSAVHLSELLQYDGGGRDLTLRKAQMVKRLAGAQALYGPDRLMAWELCRAAQAAGLASLPQLPATSVTDDNGWHSHTRNLLDDIGSFADLREDTLNRELSALAAQQGVAINRKLQRKARSEARRQKASALPETAYDELARKYPFPRALFTRTMPRFIDGKISREAAAAALLREMGDPEQFVVWYFELADGERDFSSWMRRVGETLAAAVLDLRAATAPFADDVEFRGRYRDLLQTLAHDLPKRLTRGVREEALGFGLPAAVFEAVSGGDVALQAPFAQRLSSLMPDYLDQHSAFRQQARTPRASDGGDLLHALALPYCDLWRGDGYYCDLVEKHLQPNDGRVVRRLTDLPDAIERLAAGASGED